MSCLEQTVTAMRKRRTPAMTERFTKDNQETTRVLEKQAFREAVRRSPSAMQNKSFTEGRSPGLRRVHAQDDPERSRNLRLPMPGLQHRCTVAGGKFTDSLTVAGAASAWFAANDKRTDFPIKSCESKFAGYPRQCYPGSI